MQSKKILTVLGLLAAVAAGLILLSWPKNSPKEQGEGQAAASAKTHEFDFGEVSMAKGLIKHSYEIVNSQDESLTIKKIYTSCMCTTASLIRPDGRRVGPFGMPGHGGPIPTLAEELFGSEKAQVEVVFDPAAHGPAGLGRVERFITVETSNGPIELSFTAEVIP